MEEARFLVNYYNSDKWSWDDRLGRWARWTMPTPLSDDSTTTVDATSPALRPVLEMLRGRVTTEPPGQPLLSPTGWPASPHKSTIATFGHVLHPYHAEGAKPPNHQQQQRILTPVIPPLASLSLPRMLHNASPSSSSSTILMRFLPHPRQYPSPKRTAPPLELRLNATDTEIQGISSLRALVSTSTHDILLPSNPVDIRISTTDFIDLPGSVLAADPRHADPLLSFLEGADLRPDAGRLVTPPLLRDVVIPAVGASESTSTTTTTTPNIITSTFFAEEEGTNHDSLMTADYVFAGLEVRRSVAADYDGWRLVYTTVEAGQGGGRRAELTLEAVPSEAAVAEGGEGGGGKEPKRVDDEERLRRLRKGDDGVVFLETLLKMAMGGEFKWYGERV